MEGKGEGFIILNSQLSPEIVYLTLAQLSPRNGDAEHVE